MDTFDWLKPAPLWQKNGRDLLLPAYKDSFRRPQMLAFQGDNFMEAFFAVAAAGQPADFPIAQNEPLMTSETLKLFQPAHGRFYLVCASLCCVRPGFPDRAIRPADNELVYFVLRKLQDGVEYGWVLGPAGPLGWQPLSTSPTPVLAGEEKLPLAFTPTGEGRKLMFGYLPVASRDTYDALPAELPGVPVDTDARIMELQGRFSRQLAWVDAVPATELYTALRLSVYMLLDLWEYLATYLAPVGTALLENDTSDLQGANAALVSFLESEVISGSVTLASALNKVALARTTLNELSDEDNLPAPFHNNYAYSLRNRSLDTTTLETRVDEALAEADAAAGVTEKSVTIPKLRPETGETFIVRCVYERPRCSEKRYWVSQPSVEFKMAAFFDADAPARPVRIPLPEMNMSSLRRFKKGVGFIMSPKLKDKIDGIGPAQIGLLDSQQLAELSLGLMCTFSIPIITLCAFILLLVLVIVLNIVFWWIPFFKICLPVPQVE